MELNGALISEDQLYRYSLWRIWDNSLPKVMWIMLNPSTADGDVDDPTIRRCMGFAKSWGYGGIMVGNLFAFRATDPKQLTAIDNPEGERNKEILTRMSKQCDLIVLAWGNAPIIKKIKPDFKVNHLFYLPMEKMMHLEIAKTGTPKHPLYLKGNLKPKPMFSGFSNKELIIPK